ncbi:MAG: LytR/AlgR family response regulator transcription factor [Lachnospiraceae bacterium]
MLNVVICDDEEICREELKRNIVEASKLKLIDTYILEFEDSEHILIHSEDWIDDADVVFMDIRLKNDNGITVAKEIRAKGFRGEIVFLTSSKEYAFQSFEVNPLNYLVKNCMSFDNFLNEFEKIIIAVGSNKNRMFLYNIGREKFLINLQKVVSFEIRKRVVEMCIVDEDGNYSYIEFYSTLENVELKTRGTMFLKPHRSFILNPDYIVRLSSSVVEIGNGRCITISRRFKDDLEKDFEKYLQLTGIELK